MNKTKFKVLNLSIFLDNPISNDSGADGLLKLWTIKTNDCVNTFDRHEDKVCDLYVLRMACVTQ